jgi:hypothetical protein
MLDKTPFFCYYLESVFEWPLTKAPEGRVAIAWLSKQLLPCPQESRNLNPKNFQKGDVEVDTTKYAQEVKDCKCNEEGICQLGSSKLPCAGQICVVKEM